MHVLDKVTIAFWPEWFHVWFHQRSKPVQCLIALPICAVLMWQYWGTRHSPKPGEPVQAIYIQLILLVVAFVLSELLRPKPEFEDARPKGLGDFKFPTATESRKQPIIFGRVLVDGPNVIWYGDLEREAISETVRTGLWSKSTFIKGYRYKVGMQMGICRGSPGTPVTLRRVLIGEKEGFSGTVSTDTSFDIDKPQLFGGDETGGNGGVQATIDWHVGSTTQPVSAYLQQHQDSGAGTDRTPRYTGMVHAVVRELGAAAATAGPAYLGNSSSIEAWKFEVERFPGIFPGQTAGQEKIGAADCNPMNVVYELLRNTEWGMGEDIADIDVGAGSSFKKAEETLRTEGAGFSMVVDREMKASQLLQELMRHIDGVIAPDPTTGKWTVTLARGPDDSNFGYDINTVPQFVDGKVKKVQDFTRGAWDDTTNQIVVRYHKRADDYKESHAVAQDMANALIQGDGTIAGAQVITGDVSYPGIKDSSYAAKVAWRDLRSQTYPLARGTFIVDRTFWDLSLGAVVAWTNAELGFTKLPMRVTRIDYGKLDANQIEVQAVQDVFKFAAASFGDPPDSGWTPPTFTPVAYPSDEQHAEEAPRGIIVRDPDYKGDDTISKVHCAARKQTNEIGFQIQQRNHPTAPSGSYAAAGEVRGFLRIGSLKSALDAGTAIPTGTITIEADPDSQSRLEAIFDDSATDQDLGVDLLHLIKIGNEYMLVRSASNGAGTDVDLENVYRGVLDTAQMNHSAGADVLMLFVGSGLTETTFDNTYRVDVQLMMRSASVIFSGSPTVFALQMAKRAIRPYPPASIRYNATSTDYGTPDLEGDGSGLDGFGYDVDWLRRRFNTGDEVASMKSDDTAVDASTEYRVRVFVDPDGANTEVHTTPWATGNGLASIITRLEIVNEAAAGTKIRTEIEVRHDIGTETNLEGRYELIHDKVPTSTLTSQFYLGGKLRANVVSNSYTALQTGTYTVNIGSTFNSQIQFRLNGGTWTNLTGYTPGVSTSGTIPGVTATDTIEIRHQTNPASPPLTFLELQDTGATSVAYGVLSN